MSADVFCKLNNHLLHVYNLRIADQDPALPAVLMRLQKQLVVVRADLDLELVPVARLVLLHIAVLLELICALHDVGVVPHVLADVLEGQRVRLDSRCAVELTSGDLDLDVPQGDQVNRLVVVEAIDRNRLHVHNRERLQLQRLGVDLLVLLLVLRGLRHVFPAQLVQVVEVGPNSLRFHVVLEVLELFLRELVCN